MRYLPWEGGGLAGSSEEVTNAVLSLHWSGSSSDPALQGRNNDTDVMWPLPAEHLLPWAELEQQDAIPVGSTVTMAGRAEGHHGISGHGQERGTGRPS